MRVSKQRKLRQTPKRTQRSLSRSLKSKKDVQKSCKPDNTDDDLNYYNNFYHNQRQFNQILKKLYLGSSAPVQNADLMKRLSIRHVISVQEDPVADECQLSDISYHHIEAGDFPDEDLLSAFNYCYDIIFRAHENGESVYVHCGGGFSRSATIVMAFLMKKLGISYQTSRERVEKKRKVFPNEGFVNQLILYERMNYTIDGYHQEYRRFLLKSLTYQLRSNGLSVMSGNKDCGDRDRLWEYEYRCVKIYWAKIRAAEQTSEQVLLKTAQKGRVYHCCGCNYELFSQMNIIVNQQPMDENVPRQTQCQVMFIEPLENTYCTKSNGDTSGLVMCPRCQSCFGTYNWLLYDCNCLYHQNSRECLAVKVQRHKVY